MRDEEVQWGLEAWKVTVEVQQHFNDIELRIRNYALTLLVAVLGAAGVALREGTEVRVLGGTTSLATVLLFAGFVAWRAFYFVDRIWYHRLLQGAVQHGIQVERELSSHVPGIGLTQSIGRSSPYRLWRWELHTDDKIRLFYSIIGLVLLVFAAISHFSAGGSPPSTRHACEISANALTCTTEDGSVTCTIEEAGPRCKTEVP